MICEYVIKQSSALCISIPNVTGSERLREVPLKQNTLCINQ